MKANKYHAKKITVDGQTFDSRKEYLRFKELELLERSGKIQNLKRQVEYMLLPSQFGMEVDENGRRKRVCWERAARYVADFTYTENGQFIAEDCKGFRTKDYILKRKMMLYFFNIRIRET